MSKFVKKEVTTKDFYGQRQITDIFTSDINKVVISDNVQCNNGKGCRYTVGYQADGVVIPPRHLGIYLVIAYRSITRTLPIQYHLVSLKQKSECLNIKRFGIRLSHSYLKTWRQNR